MGCILDSLCIPQHAFENLEEEAKDDIVNEILNCGHDVFSEVVKNQWGAYCIQHSNVSILFLFGIHFSDFYPSSRAWLAQASSDDA
jgi:hypothetical protein